MTFYVFRGLHSKGYYLARPLGLLLTGYVFWILTSIGLLRNDLAGQIVALILVVIVNLIILRKSGMHNLQAQLAGMKRLIIGAEGMLLISFVFWVLIRSTNPEIIHTEKFMEMAFINGILRSPSFPPIDPWLSGYGISYYYFGYVLVALLIRFTGVLPEVGYNLTSASWYALTAAAAYGILTDLLNGNPSREQFKKWVYTAAILAPMMMLTVSNWHGFFDVLNNRGIGWNKHPIFNYESEFWANMDLRDLDHPPEQLSWFPQRNYQWWSASRTLQDYTLDGRPIEIIDEFPNFTFLLSDIHPHLLGMPFVLTAVALALNAAFGGWKGSKPIKILKWVANEDLLITVVTMIVLGGIAFLNTWDFPFYTALIVVGLIYRTYLREGLPGRARQFLVGGIILGVMSILLYLPFYLTFSSQAGGILPSLVFTTKSTHFYTMFGPLILPILAFLIYAGFKKDTTGNLTQVFIATVVVLVVLIGITFLIAVAINYLPSLKPLVANWLGAQVDQSLINQTMVRRMKDPLTHIALFTLLFLFLTMLMRDSDQKEENRDLSHLFNLKSFVPDSFTFVMLMGLIGLALVIIPEYIFLRDLFFSRMNTIFKFYYQAWILWSLVASFLVIGLVREMKSHLIIEKVAVISLVLLGLVALVLGSPMNSEIFERFNNNLGAFGSSPLDYVMLAVGVVFVLYLISGFITLDPARMLSTLSIIAIALGMIYPVVATWNKTQGYGVGRELTFRETDPTLMEAVHWLRQAPLGTMAEAVADAGGSYTTYNMVSAFSGMPAVLGWVGHESQWRGGYEEIGTRQDDLRLLYSTSEWDSAQSVLDRYHIRYVLVSHYERDTYNLEEAKFADHLSLAFESGDTRIFEVAQP